jgi:hypothetical protein
MANRWLEQSEHLSRIGQLAWVVERPIARHVYGPQPRFKWQHFISLSHMHASSGTDFTPDEQLRWDSICALLRNNQFTVDEAINLIEASGTGQRDTPPASGVGASGAAPLLGRLLLPRSPASGSTVF